MALGKVETIDPSNTTGTVSESESGDIFNFNDPNFPSSGLKVGDACTFDIDYSQRTPTATNLQAYTPSEVVINSAVDGPITTAKGETLRVGKGGMVRGNITVSNNSNLFIEDSGAMTGELVVDAGSNAVIRKGGMVNGNVTVSNGSALKIVNKGVIKGNVTFSQGNRLIIGNDNGGGTVTGAVTTDRIRKLTITATSVINCGA